MNPLLLTDFYKVGHIRQYPKGTNLVYSNLTPRKSRDSNYQDIVFFGLQYFIKEYLQARFMEDFFLRPEKEVVDEYAEFIKHTIGEISVDHVRALHRLGYLPIAIRAVKEGQRVPFGVPALVIRNTHPDFFWVTNYLETLMSAVLWMPCTSATIAARYKRILSKYARETGMDGSLVPFQAHDFSMRGMSSPESAMVSGMAHLLSFVGTDTMPAIQGLCDYYGAVLGEDLIGTSVPATEHSVMCSGGQEDEFETFRRLIEDIYPHGIVSVVSDTWDLWKVLTDYLPRLKDVIMARNGKVVIRPDSGDPLKILCGDPAAPVGSPAYRGVFSLLWDAFGGTYTVSGHRVLDSHIGTIYGDSITPELAELISLKLSQMGFASQAIFGVGSFSYQYNTRDTFGFAVKATYVEIDGVGREIFKDPITDNGTKRSARGLLKVVKDPSSHGRLKLIQGVSTLESVDKDNELELVYMDGRLYREQSYYDIRELISAQRV